MPGIPGHKWGDYRAPDATQVQRSTEAEKPNLPALDAAAQAKKAGCEAYRAGDRLWACPLDYSEYLQEWQDGWCLAMRLAHRLAKVQRERPRDGVTHTAKLLARSP